MSAPERERRGGARRGFPRNYITYLLSVFTMSIAEGVPPETVYPALARVIEEEVASYIIMRPELMRFFSSAVAEAWRQYVGDVAPPDISRNVLRAYDIVKQHLYENMDKVFPYTGSLTETEVSKRVEAIASRIIVTAGKSFFRMLGLLK